MKRTLIRRPWTRFNVKQLFSDAALKVQMLAGCGRAATRGAPFASTIKTAGGRSSRTKPINADFSVRLGEEAVVCDPPPAEVPNELSTWWPRAVRR